MTCIELCATGQKSLSHRKARIWVSVAFQTNSTRTPKHSEAKPSFRDHPTPSKTTYAFPHSPLG